MDFYHWQKVSQMDFFNLLLYTNGAFAVQNVNLSVQLEVGAFLSASMANYTEVMIIN